MAGSGINGRNGFDVPQRRRSIPIRVRICSSEHAKDLELYQWMARSSGLAGFHRILRVPDGQRHSHLGLHAEPFLCAYCLVSRSGTILMVSGTFAMDGKLTETRQGTLMTMAVGAFAISFNVFATKHLPLFEVVILVMFLVGFFVVIIPLWVLAPRASVGDVFGKFENWGGWYVICEQSAWTEGTNADWECTKGLRWEELAS
jgi:hypothetical protein